MGQVWTQCCEVAKDVWNKCVSACKRLRDDTANELLHYATIVVRILIVKFLGPLLFPPLLALTM